MAGSALYMAPELFSTSLAATIARGEDDDDNSKTIYDSQPTPSREEKTSKLTTKDLLKSDIYSLGILLVEICGGKAPWAGKSFLQIIEAHRTKEKREIPKGLIPQGIDSVIKLCIVRDPDERPSVSDVLDSLKQLKNGIDSSYNSVIASMGVKGGKPPASASASASMKKPAAANSMVTVAPSSPPKKAAVVPQAATSMKLPEKDKKAPPPSAALGSSSTKSASAAKLVTPKKPAASSASAKKCDECEDQKATIRCDECDQNLCEDCNGSVHKSGKRATHTTTAMIEEMEIEELQGVSAAARAISKSIATKTKQCDECDDRIAVVRCDECQQFMCKPCGDSLHKAGKRMAHTLLPI